MYVGRSRHGEKRAEKQEWELWEVSATVERKELRAKIEEERARIKISYDHIRSLENRLHELEG